MANTYFTYTVPDFIAFTKIRSADVNSRFAQLSNALNQGTLIGFTDQISDPATPSSGSTIIYTKNKQLYTQDDTGTVTKVGSGSSGGGSGGVNYITNPDAEIDATGYSTYNISFTGTISNGSPAIVTAPGHGLTTGFPILFSSTGTLPTGLSPGLTYYTSVIDVDTFNVSASPGGPLIDTSSAGSGTHLVGPLRPKDGTGGVSTLTFTRTTSNPLRGVGSFLITKSAVSVIAGQGISTSFTLDRADQGQMITIGFDYSTASGTFIGPSSDSLGDMNVYIYDVTNSQLIQPTPFRVEGLKTGLKGKFTGEFQAPTNSLSYKLILHFASINGNQFTFEMDTISVGPTSKSIGPAVTDWTEYALAITGSTTNPTVSALVNKAMWRRVGDSMEISYNLQLNSSGNVEGSGEYYFSMPSGYNIDSSKTVVGSVYQGTCGNGSATWASGPTGLTANFYVFPKTSTKFGLGFLPELNATAVAVSDANGNFRSTRDFFSSAGSNGLLSFNALVPITGWSSNTAVSSDTDTRIVAFKASLSIDTGFSSATPMPFDVINIDTHSGYSFAAGQYTVPVPGFYRISLGAQPLTGASGNISLYVNGVATTALTSTTSAQQDGGSTIVKVYTGDTLDIRSEQGIVLAGGVYSSINIERLSGPAQIAASEAVYANIQNLTQNVPINVVDEPIQYSTVVLDSHSAFNTGTFTYTVPTAGVYDIYANMQLGMVSTEQYALEINLLVNGSKVTSRSFTAVMRTTGDLLSGVDISDMRKLYTGDTISVVGAVFAGGGGSFRSISTTSGVPNTSLIIKRIGN